jgi:hypothetical protein
MAQKREMYQVVAVQLTKKELAHLREFLKGEGWYFRKGEDATGAWLHDELRPEATEEDINDIDAGMIEVLTEEYMYEQPRLL